MKHVLANTLGSFGVFDIDTRKLKRQLNVAFFHGLESGINEEKKAFLEKKFAHVYYPKLDYFNDKEVFSKMLKEIKEREIRWLIGSSMGGWMAYALSTHTGNPCILFNPALAMEGKATSHNVEVPSSTGDEPANKYILLGKNDDVIDYRTTEEYLKKNNKGTYQISYGEHKHRTAYDLFAKMIDDVFG